MWALKTKKNKLFLQRARKVKKRITTNIWHKNVREPRTYDRRNLNEITITVMWTINSELKNDSNKDLKYDNHGGISFGRDKINVISIKFFIRIFRSVDRVATRQAKPVNQGKGRE